MAVRNNPVLGYIECDKCGERASVHQVARGKLNLGKYYTRGCQCKCRQEGDAGFQTYVHEHVKFLPGAEVLPHPLLGQAQDAPAPGDQVENPEPGEGDQVTEQVNQDAPAPGDQVENPEPGEGDQVIDQAQSRGGLVLAGVVILGGLAAIVGLKR